MAQITPEIKSYFASLHSRYEKEARPVTPKKVEGWEWGWEPLPAYCHDNVEFEVSLRPSLIAVQGWFVHPQGDEEGRCRYVSHAVVQDGEALYDITPIGEDRPLFLRHIGEREVFDRLKMTWTGVFYPFLTDPYLLLQGSAEIADPFIP